MNFSPWDRKLWGVELRKPRETPLLIGIWKGAYSGEPRRALLFTTRAAARAWAKLRQAFYERHHDWRFVAVKVRETVWLHDLGGSSAPHWGPSQEDDDGQDNVHHLRRA